MKRSLFSGLICLCFVLLLTSCSLIQPSGLAPLPKVDTTPPASYTKGAPAYEMLFHTTGSGMPGVSGLMGAGDSRIMTMRMISQPGPAGGAAPKAYHMIPPGMSMGEYLPLLPPVKESAKGYPGGAAEKPERMTLKIYWGCGESVRKGQPKVISSDKGAGMDVYFSEGRTGSSGIALRPGWAEALWPNKDDSRPVPSWASLEGGHFIHGNFLPHIRFAMDKQHDFMAKLSVSAGSQSLQDAVPITWNKLPTAIGYHVMAVAFNDARKEVIIWTSSENPNVNVSGRFLETPLVKRHIGAKIILPPERDRCVIPKGIFAGTDAVVVTVTAWGDDYWASEPPRPARPPKNWRPDWVVKGQFLSTGNLMLGMPAGSSPGLGNILRGLF